MEPLSATEKWRLKITEENQRAKQNRRRAKMLRHLKESCQRKAAEADEAEQMAEALAMEVNSAASASSAAAPAPAPARAAAPAVAAASAPATRTVSVATIAATFRLDAELKRLNEKVKEAEE